MKGACCAFAALAVILAFGFFLPSWSGGPDGSGDETNGSKSRETTEKSNRDPARSRRQRFEKSLSDPAMLLELMPELVESTYFRDAEEYRKLLSALKYFDDDQLVQLIEIWPETIPVDFQGKPLNIPGIMSFTKDLWHEAIRKQTPAEQQAKRGIEIARKIREGSEARAYMFRYSINQADQFTPDDFSFLMNTNSFELGEILMITSAIRMRHYKDLEQGKVDAINDYLQLTNHPRVVSSLVSDVIDAGTQDAASLTHKSKWLSTLDDDFLSSSDNRLIRESVNAGVPEVAREHIERLRENPATKRRADSASRFLQAELRK